MESESENIVIKEDKEDSVEDWGDDYPPIEHTAKVEVLDAIGNRKARRISYTLLLTDESNLNRPIGIELYVEADGQVSCQAVETDDLQRDYHIEIKVPSRVR